MKEDHRRHDISDRAWKLLEPHLPGRRGAWGRVAKDNRKFINAVVWILRTGAPWRDLPPDYGDWKNTHRRFCRWRDKGVWEKLFNLFVQNPDFEWLMIVDSFGMPVRVIITDGTVADCSMADELIEGFDADYLLADRGYDTDQVIEQAVIAGMKAVIPPKKNRKIQREYENDIYENRYQIEKSFLKMKYWRGIATRYAKTTLSYKASVQICCVFMWLNIL